MGFGEPWNAETERFTGAVEGEGNVGVLVRPGSSLALGDRRGPVHEDGRRGDLPSALRRADQETLPIRGDGVIVSDRIPIADNAGEDGLWDSELERSSAGLNVH